MKYEVIPLTQGELVPADYIGNESARLYFGSNKSFGEESFDTEDYQHFVNLDCLGCIKDLEFSKWKSIEDKGQIVTRVKLPKKGGLMIERKISGQPTIKSRFDINDLETILKFIKK